MRQLKSIKFVVILSGTVFDFPSPQQHKLREKKLKQTQIRNNYQNNVVFTIRLFHARRNGTQKIVRRQIHFGRISMIDANCCKITKNFVRCRVRTNTILILNNLSQHGEFIITNTHTHNRIHSEEKIIKNIYI